MRRQSRGCLLVLVLPLLAILCLGGFFGLNRLIEIPDEAQFLFGPPDPNLNALQRYRLAWILVSEQESLISPVDPSGEPQPFTISFGESVPSFVGRLYQSGLIPNPEAFQTYLQYSGLDRSIQAGDYELSPRASPIAIARSLQDSTPSEVTVQILPGWRREEIAEALSLSGLVSSPQAFLAAARTRPMNDNAFPSLPPGTSLEGFLFPDRYTFKRNSSPSQLVAIFLANFDRQVDASLRAGFTAQGLDLHQAVILASIVEREAVNEAEGPLIASVFLNRLAAGMNLDADPTVQYALGYNKTQNTWWTNPLSLKDLEINSSYNTYRYPGLPPGPISNPGLAALAAVANPTESPYYYFRAACDSSGNHNFSETFAEHQGYACR